MQQLLLHGVPNRFTGPCLVVQNRFGIIVGSPLRPALAPVVALGERENTTNALVVAIYSVKTSL